MIRHLFSRPTISVLPRLGHEMPYTMKPMACDPARTKGMSERLIISHYENNHGEP
jgi:hypothetical protein